MSRSRAIDIRLERLVPAMEEYFIKGIFTKDELRDIAKQRTNHEYKLVARPLLYVDVRKAIDFELELESRVAKFLEGAETQIKNRTAIIERIVHIYDIAIPSICKGGVHTTRQQELERDALEMQYLTFMKQFNRTQELSKYLAAELQRAPSNVNAWVFSVDWELSKGNVDNARSIAQEALKHCSSTSPKAWTSLMTVETSFASSLARGILETDKTTTTGTKKNNNNNDNEDSQQQEDADEKPLSQRYFNTNAALAKIVVDGELIKGTCAAALDSQTGGIALLEDAEANLIKISSSSSPSNTSDMCGRFIAKYLFGACAQKQLDEQQRYEKEAESETQSDTNNKNKNSASLAVATKQQRSLNLTVSALAHLIQTPFNFFFSGSSLASSKRASSQHHLHHQYWSTSNYMDQTPDPCPLPQTGNNNKNNKSKKNTKRQNDDDNDDEKNTDEYSTSERSIAAQTLQQLVAFSRSSTHPLVIKATLEFAEKIYSTSNNNKRLITKQQLGEILSGDVSSTTSKQQLLASGCAPACQQAFDECVTEFNRLNQQLQAAFNNNNNNKNNSNNKKSSSSSSFYDVSKELHINKWISEDFKDLLERSLNINIALSLAPKIFSTSTTTTDNTTTSACDNDNNEDSASSSTFSILDKRTRRYLASNSNDKTYNTTTVKNQLLADLNSWFNSTFGIMNKSNNKISSNTNNDLFGSEALSHQLTTMLLGRALLMMRMMSQSLPARRGRDDEDSSSSDDDDDNNKKNNGGGAFAGFFDIIRLFNLCQPKTPSQIQVRAQAVTIVASVWVEAILLQQQQKSSLTFPFIVRKDLQLPSAASTLTSLAISQLRTALTTCASVLPSSIDFLVHIAASIEYQLALAMNKNNNNKMKTEASTKMRQYFEAAVSAAPKERTTWSTWKKFETNLGNLKQAGEIQRRASQCLNDSRVL